MRLAPELIEFPAALLGEAVQLLVGQLFHCLQRTRQGSVEDTVEGFPLCQFTDATPACQDFPDLCLQVRIGCVVGDRPQRSCEVPRQARYRLPRCRASVPVGSCHAPGWS